MAIMPWLGMEAMNSVILPPEALSTSSAPPRAAPPALSAVGVLYISGMLASSSRIDSLQDGQRRLGQHPEPATRELLRVAFAAALRQIAPRPLTCIC